MVNGSREGGAKPSPVSGGAVSGIIPLTTYAYVLTYVRTYVRSSSVRTHVRTYVSSSTSFLRRQAMILLHPRRRLYAGRDSVHGPSSFGRTVRCPAAFLQACRLGH